MTDLYQVNLQKQTIVQLTALCREHKLSGYSKLKKAALIEKLEAYRDRSKASVPVINIQPGDSDPPERYSQQNSAVFDDALGSAPSSGPTALVRTVPSKVALQINHNEKPVHLNNVSKPLNLASSSKILHADTCFIASVATPLSSTSNIFLPAAEFLKPKPTVTPTTLPEKRPIGHLPVSIARAPKKRLLNPVNDSRASKALFLTPKPHAIPVQGAKTVLPPAKPVARNPLPRDITRTGKRRFVPLKAKQTAAGEPVVFNATLPSCSAGILQPYLVDKEYDAPLSNISIPPSLSQRKRVKALALILRDLSDADRQTCCFASRALRYAGTGQ
jgi:Rho termination factor, N-terminal domain